MNAAVQAVDLANYAAMAQRMFPASVGLALCDGSGTALTVTDDSFDERLGKLTDVSPDWATRVQDLERIDLGSDGAVLIMNLQVGADPAPGFLLWWIADTISDQRSADLHDTLLSLGVCVRNELELQTELDNMALELAERYEELNLVYHTDDQVSYFREGYEAFRALVQNCADYLNAGLAVIYLRDKGVFVESHTALDATDVRLIQSVVDDYLYDRVAGSGDVEFLNNVESRNDKECAPVPYRLMAGPVVSFGEQTDGVLLIANLLSGKPFSNSDKNLLAVMSRKAAKIIQGSYDGLTGLLNRASFENLVQSSLATLRSRGGDHCLLHINVDKLHRINETVGHEAGDMVIRAIAKVVADELRDTDTLARLGGDDLGLLINNCSLHKGVAIAEKLTRHVVELPLEWQGERLNVTASIGVATLSEAARSSRQAMKCAVMACDVAKENGGNTVQVYEHDDARLKEREANMWMVGTVHSALREGRFMLYAQPIVPLKRTGEAHLEILLRMQDGDKIVSPASFLPASERYQMMQSIDRWVVENSLLQIGMYLDSEPRVRPVFGINLSGQSFCTPDFLDFALDILRKSQVPPELICFEITETAAVANLAQAQEFISALRAEGCQFALDDFGAGLSSFGYLKSFDVQYLKIDGALVRDIADDKVNAAMVESVTQIGHMMGLKTIAEFVETAQARAMLTNMGVDFIQGYLIGRPSPLQEQLAALDNQPAVSAL